MKKADTQNWKSLEARLGLKGLRSHVENDVLPQLRRLGPKSRHSETVKAMTLPFFAAFLLFGVLFMTLDTRLPESWPYIVLRFVIFFPLFFGLMGLTGLLFRKRIKKFIVQGKDIFLVRSRILKDTAQRLGLEFVPLPGGPSKGLRTFANWKFAPEIIKEAVEIMEDHGGMEAESDIIRRSGLADPDTYVLGSDDSKSNFYEQWQANLQFEDGFRGVRSGLGFNVMEWSEINDDTTIHHLMLSLKLPRPISGRVEFRNKQGHWPYSKSEYNFQPVSLISSKFRRAWKVRATDQVESRFIFDPLVIERLTAFAHDAPLRGAVFDQNLVIDVIGKNRFELIDLITGEWSEASLARTYEDIAEMLELVDAIAHVFSVKPAAPQKINRYA